jgi:hypothetical protein
MPAGNRPREFNLPLFTCNDVNIPNTIQRANHLHTHLGSSDLERPCLWHYYRGEYDGIGMLPILRMAVPAYS